MPDSRVAGLARTHMSTAPDTEWPAVATDEPTDCFEHVIVDHPNGPDECAFVPPADASASESTGWIRATGDGFVDRERMR